MIELDSAGKTTIRQQFKFGEIVTTVSTIGFNVESVEYKNVCFTVWNIGGKDWIPNLWRHYVRVDSSDWQSIQNARSE